MSQPLILSVDTAGPFLACTVSEGLEIRSQVLQNTQQEHCKNIIQAIDEALTQADIALDQCDAFACIVGPGSFTGLRIGLMTIKTFGFVHHKPLIGIDSLHRLKSPTHKKNALYLWPAQKSMAYGLLNEEITFDSIENFLKNSTSKIYHPEFLPLEDPRSVSLRFDAICATTMIENFVDAWEKKQFLDPTQCEPLYIQKVAAKPHGQRDL